MITRQEYENAVIRALHCLDSAGIVTTPEERVRLEVADFGLGELEQTGPRDTYLCQHRSVLRKRACNVPAADLPRTLAPYH